MVGDVMCAKCGAPIELFLVVLMCKACLEATCLEIKREREETKRQIKPPLTTTGTSG